MVMEDKGAQYFVLLVEGSAAEARLTKHALLSAGLDARIEHLLSGREAMAYLKVEASRVRYPLPCVILIDLRLPDMEGFHLLEWIRSQPHLGRIVVIVQTDVAEVMQIQRAYHLGANSFITRNANPEEMKHLVTFLQSHAQVSTFRVISSTPPADNPPPRSDTGGPTG